LYDFALGDTVDPRAAAALGPRGALRVRPKDFGMARLVGTLFVDAETPTSSASLSNFTPRAYLDPQIEDVSIVLDNALWDGRFWLPYRQEVEIRRRATWLDIRRAASSAAAGRSTATCSTSGSTTAWFAARRSCPCPKRSATLPVARAPRRGDPGHRRAGAPGRPAGGALRGRAHRRRRRCRTPAQRLGVRGVSDVLRANRVEGLAGARASCGRTRRPARGPALASYGFANRRVNGGLTLSSGSGMELAGYRQVRDVADVPVIAPLLNSIASQEFGDDYGDTTSRPACALAATQHRRTR